MLNLLINSIKINNNLIIIVSILILLVIIGVVALIIYKDKKCEEEEIDELISDMKKEDEEDLKVSENTIKIEGILDQMQKDLDAKPEEVVNMFEKEQEEKAIISYQELVKQLKKGKKEENVIKVDEDTLKGDKTLNQLVDELKNPKKQDENLSDTKKFKNTDFISPIYGKLEDKLEYPRVKSFKNKEIDNFDEELNKYNLDSYLEEFKNDTNINTLEQTLDMEPISKEIKQNEEFLKALKDFRENL